MTKCCVIGCKNVGIHKFPKDPAIRKKWIRAIRIKKFEPTKTSRLCRAHFDENDYQSISTTTGLPPVHRYLRKNAVPSKFSWQQKPISESSVTRAERCERRSARRNIFAQPSTSQQFSFQDPFPSTSQDQNVAIIVDHQANEFDINNRNEDKNKELCKSVGTQTSAVLALFSTDMMLSDDESVYYYTGLESAGKFRLVLSTLMPMAEHLEYRWSNILSLSIDDQFLLLLIKLRRIKPDFELAKMFGISKTQVSNIFITWVNFVSDVWSLLDIWPSRDLVNYYMPEQFKQNKMPTRIIIDCTEIPIAKPSNPSSQQITFSSYKNRNTIKFLVGSTPGGLLSYCSEGFGGSTSDRQMIERSTLINMCDDGDSIMADRGFNVQDLFAPRNIGINIPTFLRGKTQLPGLALLNDRKVASQRVHIERLIGLTKTYKILKTELNAYYVPLASKIFFICVMLCNFRECIMNKTSKKYLIYLFHPHDQNMESCNLILRVL